MRFGVCNKPIVALYEAPEFCRDENRDISGVADELLYGWTCRIDEEWEDCLKVTTDYGYPGYVNKEDMIFFSREQELPKDSFIKYVNKNTLDVLSIPKVQGRILTTLYRGSFLKGSGSFENPDGWQEVILEDGRVGYVQGTALTEWKNKEVLTRPEIKTMLPEVPLRNAIVAVAMEYLGTQYRWGGKTGMGIDCSGLAFMSYFENGFKIYRDAVIKEGYPIRQIPTHMMNKGDLLFFPGHVAIYLDKGKYIHATAHRQSFGVVINSLYPWDADFRSDLYEKLTAVGSIFG